VRYDSKAALIASIEHEHEEFVGLASSLPQRDLEAPGVWGDAWTIKDLFAHLTEWEQMFLRWYRDGLEGVEPSMPAAGYKWNETPRLNRAIWRKHRRASWSSVRRRFDASYEEILALSKSLPEEALLSPGQFAWTKANPLVTYLGANTSSHYRTATKILKRWLRHRGN
jgi:hypothetical protein